MNTTRTLHTFRHSLYETLPKTPVKEKEILTRYTKKAITLSFIMGLIVFTILLSTLFYKNPYRSIDLSVLSAFLFLYILYFIRLMYKILRMIGRIKK